MGWNDRLVDDPYGPTEEDRQAYFDWQEYQDYLARLDAALDKEEKPLAAAARCCWKNKQPSQKGATVAKKVKNKNTARARVLDTVWRSLEEMYALTTNECVDRMTTTALKAVAKQLADTRAKINVYLMPGCSGARRKLVKPVKRKKTDTRSR